MKKKIMGLFCAAALVFVIIWFVAPSNTSVPSGYPEDCSIYSTEIHRDNFESLDLYFEAWRHRNPIVLPQIRRNERMELISIEDMEYFASQTDVELCVELIYDNGWRVLIKMTNNTDYAYEYGFIGHFGINLYKKIDDNWVPLTKSVSPKPNEWYAYLANKYDLRIDYTLLGHLFPLYPNSYVRTSRDLSGHFGHLAPGDYALVKDFWSPSANPDYDGMKAVAKFTIEPI